ncbi:hypothetical protein ACLOJK_015910 [Asimina triloba]
MFLPQRRSWPRQSSKMKKLQPLHHFTITQQLDHITVVQSAACKKRINRPASAQSPTRPSFIHIFIPPSGASLRCSPENRRIEIPIFGTPANRQKPAG